MGRVSASITQHMGQARAQAWRAGASHFVCCQDGTEDAKTSAGRTRLVCPGWVQDPAPLGQDGSKHSLSRPTCWDSAEAVQDLLLLAGSTHQPSGPGLAKRSPADLHLTRMRAWSLIPP